MECHWHVGYKSFGFGHTQGFKVSVLLSIKQVIKIIMNDLVRYQNE